MAKSLSLPQQSFEALRQRREIIGLDDESVRRSDGQLKVLESLQLVIPLFERAPLLNQFFNL